MRRNTHIHTQTPVREHTYSTHPPRISPLGYFSPSSRPASCAMQRRVFVHFSYFTGSSASFLLACRSTSPTLLISFLPIPVYQRENFLPIVIVTAAAAVRLLFVSYVVANGIPNRNLKDFTDTILKYANISFLPDAKCSARRNYAWTRYCWDFN